MLSLDDIKVLIVDERGHFEQAATAIALYMAAVTGLILAKPPRFCSNNNALTTSSL